MVLATGCAGASGTSSILTSSAGHKQFVPGDALGNAGKSLRSAIDHELDGVPPEKLEDKNKAISVLVGQYLKPGMTFKDAQAILTAAGLRVTKRENIMRHPRPDYRDDVVGDLVLPGRMFSKTELVISLSPKEIGDYSTVNGVNAGISTVWL